MNKIDQAVEDIMKKKKWLMTLARLNIIMLIIIIVFSFQAGYYVRELFDKPCTQPKPVTNVTVE